MSKPVRINLRRAVKRADFIAADERYKGGQWALFLDCGHVVFQSGRSPVPKQTRCVECKRAALSDLEPS